MVIPDGKIRPCVHRIKSTTIYNITLEKKQTERKKHLIFVKWMRSPSKGGVRSVWFDVVKTFSDNNNPKGGFR